MASTFLRSLCHFTLVRAQVSNNAGSAVSGEGLVVVEA